MKTQFLPESSLRSLCTRSAENNLEESNSYALDNLMHAESLDCEEGYFDGLECLCCIVFETRLAFLTYNTSILHVDGTNAKTGVQICEIAGKAIRPKTGQHDD